MPVKKQKEAPKAGKRPSARGAAAEQKTGDLKNTMAKELRALIPRLDVEGLRFLIEQAQVHLYNMQVDELNQTMQKQAALKKAAAGTKTKTGKNDSLRIEGTPGGSSFYLYYNNQSIMFSRGEIIQMVKIASAPVTKIEIQENLLNWLSRERRDIFAVIAIADKFDARLHTIAALLKKNFQVKTR